jgi:L-lactate permease
MQLFVSNVIGPELTDILSALTSIGAMVLLMKFWQPARTFRLQDDEPATQRHKQHGAGTMVVAWTALSAARRVRAAVGLHAGQKPARTRHRDNPGARPPQL